MHTYRIVKLGCLALLLQFCAAAGADENLL